MAGSAQRLHDARGGRVAARAPLWPDRANPLQDRWDAVTARLRDDPPPGGPWGFWRDWYQGLLDGTPMDPDLLRDIALIDPKHWNAGPERVNPMIHEMWMERRIAQVIAENPLALRIVFNRSKGKLEAHPLEERDLSRSLKKSAARCGSSLHAARREPGAGTSVPRCLRLAAILSKSFAATFRSSRTTRVSFSGCSRKAAGNCK